jgi:WD40 repeat protein
MDNRRDVGLEVSSLEMSLPQNFIPPSDPIKSAFPQRQYDMPDIEDIDINSKGNLNRLYEILARSVADTDSRHLAPTFTEKRTIQVPLGFNPMGVYFYQDKFALWNCTVDYQGACKSVIETYNNSKKADGIEQYKYDDSFQLPGYDSSISVNSDFAIQNIHYHNEHLLLSGGSRKESQKVLVLSAAYPLGMLSSYACFPYSQTGGVKALASLAGYVVIGSLIKIQIYDLDNHEISAQVEEPGTCLVVSEADHWVVAGSNRNGYVRLYELELSNGVTRLNTIRSWKAHTGHVNALALLKNKLLASGGVSTSFFRTDNSIHVWDLTNGNKKFSLKHYSSEGEVSQLVALPNGWLCSRTNEYKAVIWNTTTQKREFTYSEVRYIAMAGSEYLALLYADRISFISVVASTIKARTDFMYGTDFIYNRTPNLKFNLLQLHNCLKRYPHKIALAGRDLGDEEINYVLRLLSEHRSITYVDLSHNRFSMTAFEKIAEFFQHTVSPIQIIKLIGNKIDNLAFRYLMVMLAKALKKTVEEAYLQENVIEHSSDELKDIKLPAPLKLVDLSQNYLQTTKGTLFVPYRMSPLKKDKAIKSLVDPEKSVTSEQWIIGLACLKARQHAAIFLEGMNKNGQLFIESYDITCRGYFGMAKVVIMPLTPELFARDKENYVISTVNVTKDKGGQFKANLEKNRFERVNFSYFPFQMWSEKTVNCIQWCIEELKKIEVSVEVSSLALLPRTIVNTSKIVATH